MTTNRPYKNQDTSAKNVSPSLSARTVRDIKRGELGSWVLDNHSQYYNSHSAYLLSYILAKEFYNHERGYSFPSVERIAKKFGMTTRGVKKQIAAIRKARDENGNALWEIERGYSTKSGKNMANRYYPLFLKDVLKGVQVEEEDDTSADIWKGKVGVDDAVSEPSVDTDIDETDEAMDAPADIEQDMPLDSDEAEPVKREVVTPILEPLERVEVPAAELPTDEVQRAGSILRAALEAEKAKRDARATKLFPVRLAEQPRDLPQSEREANALRAVEEELSPADEWDIQFRPKTLLDMDEKIRRFESHWFIPVTDARAPQMSAQQRYVAGLLLTYWTRVGSLNATDKATLEKCLVDTWLAYPETDVRVFYRRFMHFYQGKMNEAASL